MRRAWVMGGALLLMTWSLAPVLWTAITSLKPSSEVFAIPTTYVPRRPTAANYVDIFRQRPFGRYIANSLFVATSATIIATAAAALAAYALTRLRLRAAPWVERSLLVVALIPPALLVAPLYGAAGAAGLMNSHIALSLVHAALNLPLAVWMLSAAFRAVPRELEEAALIDGYSRFGVLIRIIAPLCAPAMTATALLVFIFSWNEYALALVLVSRDELRTVPVGISLLSGAAAYDVPWGQIAAAVIVTTLPVVGAVVAFQRWIVSGLTAGALKG